jgi:hypothetical protein
MKDAYFRSNIVTYGPVTGQRLRNNKTTPAARQQIPNK